MKMDNGGRGLNRWGWPETLVLALYAAVVSAGIAWHEPWADEAQAWLLARDQPWWRLVSHSVRYEGSPGLWHSMLWLLTRTGAGYRSMHWLAGAWAAAAVVLLLRYAPFPRVLRLVLPFTFFLAYQDAVVARSYVAFTALAFGAAAMLAARRRSVRSLWALAALLGLMANLSVHCLVASVGLACVAWTERKGMRIAGPAALLTTCWVLAVASALPPADVGFPAGKNITASWNRIVATLEHKPYIAPTQPVAAAGADELVPIAPPVHHRTAWQNVKRRAARLMGLITFPLSSYRVFALAVAGLVLAHTLKRPVVLVPYLLLLAVFSSLYIAPRHTGVLLVAFLVTAWLSWPQLSTGTWARVLTAALLLVCAEQISWTAHALWSDVRGPYTGARMTADFLRTQAQGKRVDGFYYHGVAVLPYFNRNIFANQHAVGYWDWSRANRTEAEAPRAWRTHPDYVVVSGFDWGDTPDITVDWRDLDDPRVPAPPLGDEYQLLPWFEQHGYRETHRFCGHAWMRSGYAERLCDVVLQPEPLGAAFKPHG